MTREELKVHCEKQVEICEMWARHNGEEPQGKTYEEHKLILELLERESCGNAISKEAVLDEINRIGIKAFETYNDYSQLYDFVDTLPPITPQPKVGRWIRMSDLSEQEDDRYKCSCCGNVIHHRNKMNLYTFNSWCGRCGSDNGRK